MPVTELREWETSEPGISIPFFKLSYTKAEITTALEKTFYYKNQIIKYDTFGSTYPLPEPLRAELEWMARLTMDGTNSSSVLSFAPAGSFRFINTSDVPVGSSNAHTPGTPNWEEFDVVEILTSSGGSLSGWFGGTAQMRPFPALSVGNSGSFPLPAPAPKALIITSDNERFSFSFEIYGDTGGWVSLAVRRYDVYSSTIPDPSTLKSTLIASSDDPTSGETMTRYNPRTATGTIGCYVMDDVGLLEFQQELWDSNVIDSIRNALIGDGANALLGLKWFYGIGPDIVLDPGFTAHVAMGNVKFDAIRKYPFAIEHFVNYDAGVAVVPSFYGNHLDYTATTYQVYIPFVGFIDVKSEDVVGKILRLKYTIDITSGGAIVQLSNNLSGVGPGGVIYEGSCSWGYDIPMRITPAFDAWGQLAKHMTKGQLDSGESYSVGELNSDSNVMASFTPRVVARRRTDLSGASFTAAAGLPGADVVTVGSASGFFKSSNVYNAGSLAMRGSDKIIALIAEGIYI